MPIVKKIASIALAALLMVATVGITLHKHYCMGSVKNVAIFHPPDACQDESGMNAQMDCCKDTAEEFKVDDLNKAAFTFTISPNLYLIAVVSYLLPEVGLHTLSIVQTAFLNYKPPLIERDIPVAVQSFLL